MKNRLLLIPAILALCAGFVFVQTQCHPPSASQDVFAHIPREYQKKVKEAFVGMPTNAVLANDLKVYRHWGGKAEETGSPWYSPTKYERPDEARRFLALPDVNVADRISCFVIPQGTTILRGKAASMVGNPPFGEYAVGGGEQIYLANPAVARVVPCGSDY